MALVLYLPCQAFGGCRKGLWHPAWRWGGRSCEPSYPCWGPFPEHCDLGMRPVEFCDSASPQAHVANYTVPALTLPAF